MTYQALTDPKSAKTSPITPPGAAARFDQRFPRETRKGLEESLQQRLDGVDDDKDERLPPPLATSVR